MTPSGLYIHLPFCQKKCNYCDFASYAACDIEPSMIDEYLDALSMEIVKAHRDAPLRISTIYIGGGTPTVLSNEQLMKLGIICKGVSRYDAMFSSNTRKGVLPARPAGGQYASTVSNIEFTIEGNPGTLNAEKLVILKDIGCNRLSLGAQSFNDDELLLLGRIHNSNQIMDTYKQAVAAGFSNINLDLIYGLPGQDLASWKRSLELAVSLEPQHLSLYGLQIEEGTPFWDTYGDHGNSDNDDQYEMCKYAIDFLKSCEYGQYEISNFAKPGFECRHNTNYWLNGEYIGIGLSAASHLSGKRYVNSRDLASYLLDPSGCAIAESSTPKDEMVETILMNLRLLKGIDLKDFEGRFNTSIFDVFKEPIREMADIGLLETIDNHLRLSAKGLFMGNQVFVRFV